MLVEIIMPKLGETMEEGTITRWLKNEGERVSRGEPVAEVMTDKATFEIESPGDGFLRKIVAPASDTPVPVTRVIGYLAAGMDEKIPERTPHAAADRQAPAAAVAPPVSAPVPAAEGGQIRVSPRARKLAAERGVDFSRIKGSGPGGRIVEKDIPETMPQTASTPGSPPQTASTPGSPPQTASTPGSPPQTASTPSSPPQTASTPGVSPSAATPMHRATAQRMAASKREIPHFYVSIEIDMTAAAAARAKDITFNDMVIKAAARALEAFPRLNAHFEQGALHEKPEINACSAVDTAQGLAAPVVKQANRKTLAEVSARMKELKEKAKFGRFSPQDLESGTFTVTNLGMLGADSFCAIVNPPQVGILAVGSIREAPAVQAGQIAVRKLMRVTLSADHRAVDGAYGARFLARLKEILEKEHERL